MTYPQTLMQCHRLIAQLEDQVEKLSFEARYREPSKADKYEVEAIIYGLSPQETVAYMHLRQNAIGRTYDLAEMFPTKKHMQVIVSNLRKKLLPFGVKIINQSEVGYVLQGAEIK
jgi:hypothetical protein